jgi:hypothetical protein
MEKVSQPSQAASRKRNDTDTLAAKNKKVKAIVLPWSLELPKTSAYDTFTRENFTREKVDIKAGMVSVRIFLCYPTILCTLARIYQLKVEGLEHLLHKYDALKAFLRTKQNIVDPENYLNDLVTLTIRTSAAPVMKELKVIEKQARIDNPQAKQDTILRQLCERYERNMYVAMHNLASEQGWTDERLKVSTVSGLPLKCSRLPRDEDWKQSLMRTVEAETGFVIQLEVIEPTVTPDEAIIPNPMDAAVPTLPTLPTVPTVPTLPATDFPMEDDFPMEEVHDDNPRPPSSLSSLEPSNEAQPTVRHPRQFDYPPIEVSNDREACHEIYRLHKDRIMRTPQGWFTVRTEPIPHWACGDTHVRELIGNTNLCKKTKGGLVSYSSQKGGVSNIFAYLQDMHALFPCNETFIAKINRATKGKVFFNDYYFDLERQVWVDIKSSGLIPLIFIDRPKPNFDDFSEEEKEDFKREVLCFLASDEDLNMLLHALSRAVGGYKEDKVWYVFKGVRYSCKSSIQSLTSFAFAGYCTKAVAPLSKSFYTGDASANRWMLVKRHDMARIAFTNEAVTVAGKAAVLDGDFLKSAIGSGGDAVDARRHNGDETDVVMNTTWFMSFNTMPICEPRDAIQNMIPFVFPFKFVDEDEEMKDISYKKIVPGRREEMLVNTRWRDMFIMMVFQAFKPHKVKPTYSSRTEMQQLMIGHTTEPVDILRTHFRAKEGGWVSSADLQVAFQPAGLSNEALGRFLTERGYIKKKKRQGAGVRVYGYEGLEKNTTVEEAEKNTSTAEEVVQNTQ